MARPKNEKFVSSSLSKVLSDLDWSYQKLANESGVSVTSIGNAIHSGVSKRLAQKIAKGLRKNSDNVLFTFENLFKPTPIDTSDFSFRTQLSEAVSNYRKRMAPQKIFRRTAPQFAAMMNGFEVGYADTAVDRFIKLNISQSKSKRKGQLVFVVAGFGAGKTYFSISFGYSHSGEWLDDPDNNYLPLNFDLSSFNIDTPILQGLFNHLKKHQFEAPDFKNSFDTEEIVPVLDGFDLLGKKFGVDKAIDTLKKLENFFVRRNKVAIITCRTEFFERYIRKHIPKYSPVYYLKPLIKDQVAEAIHRRLQSNGESSVNKTVTSALQEHKLTHNPGLLASFLNTTKLTGRTEVYVSVLQDALYQQLRRQLERAPFDYEIEVQKTAVHEIGNEMFSRDSSTISEEQLRGIAVKSRLTNDNFEIEEQVLLDWSVCLLSRLPDRTFEFSDGTISDYFAAEKIRSELVKGQLAPFSQKLLVEEVYCFLADLLWEDGKHMRLYSILQSSASSVARANCVPSLRKLLPRLSEEDKIKIYNLLVSIHINRDEENKLLRYVCGYTAEEFFKAIPAKHENAPLLNRVSTINSSNALLNAANIHLFATVNPRSDRLQDLAASLFGPRNQKDFLTECLAELVGENGSVIAYKRILELGVALPSVIREALRIVTLQIIAARRNKIRTVSFPIELILKYILDDKILDPNDENSKLYADTRRIAPWLYKLLGLTASPTHELEQPYFASAKRIVDALRDDNDIFVRTIASCATESS